MTYRGEVKNGVIVLEPGIQLPEGAVVSVQQIDTSAEGTEAAEAPLDDIFKMGDLAVDTGIPDLATNLDHYLYGHPKRTDERPDAK